MQEIWSDDKKQRITYILYRGYSTVRFDLLLYGTRLEVSHCLI